MKRYCENCQKEVDTNIITKQEVYNICGEPVEVGARVRICSECGEEMFDEELDAETQKKMYNEYRKRHHLLFPEEIQGIRERYHLSQRAFSALLHWGDKTIRRYENGSIQDKAHNSLLVFLREPENMKQYIKSNADRIDKRIADTVLAAIGEEESAGEENHRLLSRMLDWKPSIYNGFKEFDYGKFSGMVVFFGSKPEELLEVKMNKLLNYSDMLYYKEHGVSISGSQYVHFPFGPVPERCSTIIDTMTEDGIAHRNVEFNGEYEKHEIVADVPLREGILTEEELRIMEYVYQFFKGYGSRSISDYSHKEKGYAETKMMEKIPYSYAKELSLSIE